MIKQRLNALLHYIDRNIDSPMDGDSLSSIAACSKYHFHRLFSANYGIGVAAYIRRLRLKKAIYILTFSDSPVIDIAFACGYESPEAFSRAFKSLIGQSPTAFRKKPDWSIWYSQHQIIHDIRTEIMNKHFPLIKVEVTHFPATTVAVMAHKGSPSNIGNTIREFKEWRVSNKLPPEKYRTFNFVYADPAKIDPEEYQFDLCVEISANFEITHPNITKTTIPSGKCAYIRHIGSDDELTALINYLYKDWLEKNDHEIRDFPLFLERVKLFPTVSETETVTDIYLPLV
ncbi:hypothetical protein Xmau_04161 [Xenorhabdus mauleonii]|uniref:Transcriptional regulator, AraC family n=1 Tax=Xenorhabdus mauleonii TaxID=351675 RepID=A0A1I3WXI0_9GAMM|nr:GyrI-like domain-containing protein [Xenorhabdus mauleonii]PHM36623.1 hypothetical protein Xmau_04161 [Xenorhabdus mauleonii]SFK12165.1 transcriptional regulator, AraC family [Xenorhabdus mauleonii]